MFQWLAIASVVAFALAAGPSRADDNPLAAAQRLTDEARQAEASQQFDKAEQLLKQVVELIETRMGATHPTVAIALETLALFDSRRGRLGDSVPLFERALAVRMKSVGRDNPDTARTELVLGIALSATGKPPEAEQHLRSALDIRTRVLGADHLEVAVAAYQLALVESGQHRLPEAEVLFRSAIDIAERKLGVDDRQVAIYRAELAVTLFNQGKLDDAADANRRSLAVFDKAPDANAALVAQTLNNLAEVYIRQDHQFEAKGLLERALAIEEKLPNTSNPNRARTLSNLAGILLKEKNYSAVKPLLDTALNLQQYATPRNEAAIASILTQQAYLSFIEKHWDDAIGRYRQVLEIIEPLRGTDHLETAATVERLANALRNARKYGEAKPLYERVLAIREKQLPPDHDDILIALSNLADDLNDLGRYQLAEGFYVRALTIAQSKFPPDDPRVASLMFYIAWMYGRQGRFAEAEPISRQVLEIRERTLGPDNPAIGDTLNGLAALYQVQGRDAEAELMFKRAAAVYEKAAVANPAMRGAGAAALANLARLYQREGRAQDAEPLARRANALYERYAKDTPDEIRSWVNLAVILRDEKQLDEAAEIAGKALAAANRVLGKEGDVTLHAMAQLGTIERDREQYQKAEQLMLDAIAGAEKAVGPDHPAIAEVRYELSDLYIRTGRPQAALDQIRKATDVYRARVRNSEAQRSGSGTSELQMVRRFFSRHIDLLVGQLGARPARQGDLVAEAFEIGQLATTTGAAQAVSRMGERFAAGSGKLAGIVRDRQDAVEQWARIDAQLVSSAGGVEASLDRETETKLRDNLKALDVRIKRADETLSRDFPQYLELASPQVVSVRAVQQLLASDEALVSYFVDTSVSFLWVIRKDRSSLRKLDFGRADLARAVGDLRTLLDPEQNSAMLPFDPERARALYERILAPAESELAGASHLIVVPDGPLQSLPFHILVSGGPAEPATPTDYRHVPWLARRFAISILPSVSSLKALRTLAERSHGTKPFVGVGDPILDGKPGEARGTKVASLFRGGLADVSAVRLLPPLPETKGELEGLARAEGADESSLYLRERADEALIRSMDLSPYRVVAFATHGLVAGDLQGLAEPALVLTPPKVPTVQNDGLLTASEIAQLRLNADWVILSACNTAAGDGTPGAEGLSGLAKAFFYAGSRTLLVSHWPVLSEAAVRLTTGALSELAKDQRQGRAEAFRRSMMAYLDDPSLGLQYTHPMVWAPFVVVGEGSEPR